MIPAYSLTIKDDSGGSSLKVKILGTWDEQVLYTYMYKNGQLQDKDEERNEDGDYIKFEFKSDQTVFLNALSDGEIDQETGAYTLNGSKLTLKTLYVDDGTDDDGTTIVDCQINGSKMTWTQEATVSSNTSGDVIKLKMVVELTKM